MGQSGETASVASHYTWLNRIENYIKLFFRVCLITGGILYTIIMFMTTYHIIGRYGFNNPLLGLVEISGFLLTVGLFLGFAYVMEIGCHVSVGTIVDNMPKKVQLTLDIITHGISLAVAAAACYGTLKYGFYLVDAGMSTTVMDIPIYPFVIFIGFSWGLFGIALVMREVHFITEAIKK